MNGELLGASGLYDYPVTDASKRIFRLTFIPVISRERQNFGLTKERFDELLEQLSLGKEDLFEHIFLAHFGDCRNYLVREDGVGDDLAYDATMDAMLTFRESLGRGKIAYGNLRFLLTRMARQHLYKKINKERSLPLSDQPIPDLPDELALDDASYQLLQQSWHKLGEACKALLERVYFDGVNMVKIAKEQQRTITAVRKQKERCVQKLRGWMME